MREFLLMLQGGQEAHISIDAWDMGHAIDIAREKIEEGWDIGWIRTEDGENYYPPALYPAIEGIKEPVEDETEAEYLANEKEQKQIARENATIKRALKILRKRLGDRGDVFTSPEAIKQYLTLRIAGSPHELFGTMFLDNRHRLIDTAELFRGTLDGASVYPREVVIECLQRNAVAAVVFYHNHPSGVNDPSQADLRITARLKDALQLIGVRVLDHFIVSAEREAYSLAEHGQI